LCDEAVNEAILSILHNPASYRPELLLAIGPRLVAAIECSIRNIGRPFVVWASAVLSDGGSSLDSRVGVQRATNVCLEISGVHKESELAARNPQSDPLAADKLHHHVEW
jgi:hypothetical protein